MTETNAHFWTDPAVFRDRDKKSARALIALSEVLAKKQRLRGEGEEFLGLYALACSHDPSVFTTVWRDPYSYWWVRRAYDLVAAAVREPSKAPDLEAHLACFKLIVVGLALKGHTDITFESPLISEGRQAIPGTALSLPNFPAAVVGVRSGRVMGVGDSEIRVTGCPVVGPPGMEWRLQPECFTLPGLAYRIPPGAMAEGFQTTRALIFQEALELVERHSPSAFNQFGEIARVAAFKSYWQGGYTNVSHSELPGCFICADVGDPFDLADTIVHEFYHGRLFAIEESGPFFHDPKKAVNENRYYSPWRPDQRNLQGLLHATYVFTAVGRYWYSVFKNGPSAGSVRQYALENVLRLCLQLEIGVWQLARHADFTKLGQALLADLTDASDELRTQIAAVGLPFDKAFFPPDHAGVPVETLDDRPELPIRVRQSLADHVRRYAPPDEVEEILTARGLSRV